MKQYISQTLESNSCGAHSIAYYLWETNKSQCVNDKDFVSDIHKKVQIGSNKIGIPEAYSNPGKMADELTDDWQSSAKVCMVADSYLIPLAQALNLTYENINVLDKVQNGDCKYGIIITSIGFQTQALHYMLIKYESGTFKLLDSLYNLNHSTFKIMTEIYGNDKTAWETFSLDSNGKLTLNRESAYYYTGAGITIE
jgi:hypothetical protein